MCVFHWVPNLVFGRRVWCGEGWEEQGRFGEAGRLKMHGLPELGTDLVAACSSSELFWMVWGAPMWAEVHWPPWTCTSSRMATRSTGRWTARRSAENAQRRCGRAPSSTGSASQNHNHHRRHRSSTILGIVLVPIIITSSSSTHHISIHHYQHHASQPLSSLAASTSSPSPSKSSSSSWP